VAGWFPKVPTQLAAWGINVSRCPGSPRLCAWDDHKYFQG
jgi:hypothetical protein